MRKKILIVTLNIKEEIDKKNNISYAGNSYQLYKLLLKKFDVKIYEYNFKKNITKINNDIVNQAKKVSADIIFFLDLESKPYLLSNTINVLKESYYLVSLCMDSDLYISNNNFYNQYMDYILTNSPSSMNSSCRDKVQYFDLGTYKSLRVRKKKFFDVAFLGTIEKANRREYIQFLRKNKIKVHDFGKDTSNGVVTPKKYFDIINSSKICLRFSARDFKKDISKLRQDPLTVNNKSQHIGFLDYFSCGAFLLVEKIETLKIFKQNDCFKFFRNKHDLLKKINYYLKHSKDRNKIASNGYKIFQSFYKKNLLNKLFENLNTTKKNKNKNYQISLKNYLYFKYCQNNFIIITLGSRKNLKSILKDLLIILKFPYFSYFWTSKMVAKKFYQKLTNSFLFKTL